MTLFYFYLFNYKYSVFELLPVQYGMEILKQNFQVFFPVPKSRY